MPFSIPPGLIESLRKARAVTVLTGAGISAESGVPTFRDAQTGLWAKYSPEELATPEAFQRNPKLVWDWYAWRRDKVASVRPNPGHLALAELEARLPAFTLVTQNVDGLHHRAGSKNVLELHGNITRFKCFDDNDPVESWHPTPEVPPRCPRCGGLVRPDIVWFGEALPVEALLAAQKASAESDVFFSIGTSSLVYPAAGLPLLALEGRAVVVEVNPNPTSLSRQATHSFQAPAGEFLPELVAALWSR